MATSEPDPGPARPRFRVLGVVVAYASFSALWIWLSDVAVHAVTDEADTITLISTYKGWAFVLVTSLLLYALMRGLVADYVRSSERERAARIEQDAALARLGRSEQLYRELAEQLPAIIYRSEVGISGTTTYISPQISTLGYTPDEWMAQPDTWVMSLHPEDVERTLAAIGAARQGGGDFATEYRIRDRSGAWHTFRDEGRMIRDEGGRAASIQGVMLDVTEHRRAQADADRLTNFDPLTGIPNRTLLLDRLGQMVSMAHREGRFGALLLLDVDRLKTVNDGLGHVAGDRLLVEVARRLAATVRGDDTVARLQGDEFAILLHALDPNTRSAQGHAQLVAEKIHHSLTHPFVVDGQEITITVSIGLASFPDTEIDEPADVLRRADTAMDRAKVAGGNRSSVFEVDMGAAAEQRFQTEGELRHALVSDELRLYLQPQVNSRGTIVGAEALVRWEHPTRGLVLPGAFIPYAEESDLIARVDEWVLEQVCQILATPEVADRPMRIAVNISPRHFARADFVVRVRQILMAAGADPSRLTLEVTEGLMIDDFADATTKMDQLASLGIHFSVDDFGTRYSSLAYLKRLPIHELKIDKTFVQDAPDDPDDAVLVEVILSVAAHLHLRVVAEGVETEAQAQFLNSRADVIHQGYLYGKPEPAEALLARIG